MIGLWIALGALALFAAAELIARMIIRRGASYVWAPGTRILLETDLETLPTLEPRIRLEINRDGERGPTPPENPETWRVLVAGGSAAECYFLDQDTQWAAVVAQRLSEPASLSRLGAPSLHLGNIGRSLFGAEYLDLVFEKILPRYPRLDLAIIMVGATDVVQWLKFATPAVLEDRPPPLTHVFNEGPTIPVGWHPRKLALRALAQRWNRRLRHPVEVKAKAGKKLGEARRMRAAAQVVHETVPNPTVMLDRFERYFRKLLWRLKGAKIRTLIVHQPWMNPPWTPEEEALFWGGGIGDPYVTQVTDYYRFETIAELMAAMNARAAKVADELGVPRLDLMPHLERSTKTYYDFWHFTPEGCRQVGELVSESVLEHFGTRVPTAAGSPSATQPV